ncbi:MAG: thioesterase [Symploca sp. SIO2E6]|nr:thioesterase [Symploca sp. SIO2E6]
MTAQNPWFRNYQPNPQANLRLFCFPYAGGGASIFRLWAKELPSEIEVYPVQIPGRENRLRESPFTQLSPLIQALIQVLPPYLDRPFAFFGYSMGALVSFELTRELRRQNLPIPSQLIIACRRAPQIPYQKPFTHKLSDAEFVEDLRLKGGTPEEVLQNPELMELLLPIVRADLAVNDTYSYTTELPLDCPISVLGTSEDREVSREQLDAWREHTTSSFSLEMFPGNHFFLINKGRSLLLQAISDKVLGRVWENK